LAGALRGREQRPQVALGHLGSSLELLHPRAECGRAALGVVPGGLGVTDLLARRARGPAQRPDLASELDQPLDRLAADVRVRRPPGRCGRAILGATGSSGTSASRPRDLLALAGLD